MSLRSRGRAAQSFLGARWTAFSKLPRLTQYLIYVLVAGVVVGGLASLHGGSGNSAATALPSVTLQRVDSFGGSTNSVDVLGTVQSISQADILAQSGGTVTAVNTKIGAQVPAGFVIASLDNAAAAAAVLQAQGGYDAAVAAQKATIFQSNNSAGSFTEAQTSVRNAYQATYSTLDSTLSVNVDSFYGNAGPVGPTLLISPLTSGDSLPRAREAIKMMMSAWQASLPTANTTDPLTLLNNAQTTLNAVSNLLINIGSVATQNGSGATASQMANLATARASVSGLLATISADRDAYNAKLTASAVGQTQGSATTGVTSSQASVEQALGALRSAQAAYEKTVIRAPIGGTINFLSVHVGDYATPNEHVATVARNNALEVVLSLSQANRDRLAVGDAVAITAGDTGAGASTYKGIVTSIAPALNPTTKQIEVHVAVSDSTASLVNGQSVQVALPTPTSATANATKMPASKNAATSTPSVIELPLTAVKLLPNERDVFTVDTSGHLVAHPVEISDVVGNLIEVTTPLDPSLKIVVDARGLSAGDAVLLATSSAQI